MRFCDANTVLKLMSNRTIVIAVDDSPVSKDAVRWATRKLLTPQDEVHLVSVLDRGGRSTVMTAGENTYPLDRDPGECKPDPVQLEKRFELLKSLKQNILQDSKVQKVSMSTMVSCVGGSSDLGRHICDYAADKKADMLVMGSRGMGSAQKAVLGLFGLGSVSDFVVRHASVSNVLVHRGGVSGKE